MVKRNCPTPGCPALTNGGRCRACRSDHERSRGTRQQRGYDAEYDRAHAEYQRRMDAGERFACWRCPELGRPAHNVDPRPGRWHLGHDNVDRSVIRGPQCPASNLDTAAQGVGVTPS